MKKVVSAFFCAALVLVFAGQPEIKTGPQPGTPVPHFVATDENGMSRTSESLLGPKGALLVFFRSADW